MNSENFYYRIYDKKTSEELTEIIKDKNIAIDTRNLAIEILDKRGELTDELNSLKTELGKTQLSLLRNEVSQDKYSTFWERIAANAIDDTLLKITGFASVLFITNTSAFNQITLIVASIFPYFYSIILHGYLGQTIGKMLMGIKVFDKDEVTPITMKQAFIRDCIPLLLAMILLILSLFGFINAETESNTATIFLSIILVSWTLLEIITLLFDKRRRALHDYIAGTVVLKLKNS